MTTEIDAEGLEAFRAWYRNHTGTTLFRNSARQAIRVYLEASSTSEAEPVAMSAAADHLPTFLLWVAESYEAHAKASDHPDEIEGYIGSANMARAHLAKLTLPTPASDDQVEAVAFDPRSEAAYFGSIWCLTNYQMAELEKTLTRLAAMGSTKP